jgi:hypothetical protein
MHNEPDAAKKLLDEIVMKYPYTQEATQASLFLIGYALASFARDCGRYPTFDEGLMALLTNPGVKGWSGPYWRTDSRIVLEKFDYKHRGDNAPDVVARTAKAF